MRFEKVSLTWQGQDCRRCLNGLFDVGSFVWEQSLICHRQDDIAVVVIVVVIIGAAFAGSRFS